MPSPLDESFKRAMRAAAAEDQAAPGELVPNPTRRRNIESIAERYAAANIAQRATVDPAAYREGASALLGGAMTEPEFRYFRRVYQERMRAAPVRHLVEDTAAAKAYETLDVPDHSRDPNVVEYAVQEMLKGRKISTAAATTAKRLNGGTNLFIGGGHQTVRVDPVVLEDALWWRLGETAAKQAGSYKEGMEHMALESTLQFFRQKITPKSLAEVRRRAVAKLGRDPFGGTK